MKKILSLSILLFCVLTISGQEILRLEEGRPAGKASLEQMSWLAGYWAGPGLGGHCDEVWLPAVDNSMSGAFRYVKEGSIVFTEYLVIEEIEETLALKVKHFNRDLTAWEEKDDWVSFRLIKVEGQTAYFHGLTLHRQADSLTIKLALKSGERAWEEVFKYSKQDL